MRDQGGYVVENLPTGVGMYRAGAGFIPVRESPHRRGDVPIENMELSKAISPQAWGCTEAIATKAAMVENLPTGVGMYRACIGRAAQPNKSPHRRGDVPFLFLLYGRIVRISPQAWGCTAGIP